MRALGALTVLYAAASLLHFARNAVLVGSAQPTDPSARCSPRKKIHASWSRSPSLAGR